MRYIILKVFAIVVLILIFNNCVTDKEFNSETIINDLEHTHFQELSLTDLKKILSNDKISEKEKDYIRYYITSFVDDPILRNYVMHEQITNKKNENIFSYLLLLHKIKNNDSVEIKSVLNKLNEIEPENVYVLIERYLNANDLNTKTTYLNQATKLYPNNELVFSYNIVENRLNSDTINYFKNVDEYKKGYNNYYSYFFIANEFIYQNNLDSAVLYLNKSLRKKKTIGAYLQLSDIYFRYNGKSFKYKQYLDSALIIDSNDDDALVMNAWYYYDKKDTASARIAFNNLISKHPNLVSYKELLLYYLCSEKIEYGKNVYQNFVRDSITKEEQAGYFLVFESLRKRNQLILHEQIDSIKNIYGITPIEYSNQMIEAILRGRQ